MAIFRLPMFDCKVRVKEGKAYAGSEVDERRRRKRAVWRKRKAGTLRDSWPEGDSTRHLTAGAGLINKRKCSLSFAANSTRLTPPPFSPFRAPHSGLPPSRLLPRSLSPPLTHLSRPALAWPFFPPSVPSCPYRSRQENVRTPLCAHIFPGMEFYRPFDFFSFRRLLQSRTANS